MQTAVLHIRKETAKMVVKRGDVFYADLDPIIGSEQGGCVTALDNLLCILHKTFLRTRPDNTAGRFVEFGQ